MQPQEPSLEQRQQWQYDQKKRELQIARMRAGVLRKQIAEAYEILENIRFDYLSDTAFRDKITKAKKGCEQAIGDFLLDDNYWKERYTRHIHMSPQEYDAELNNPATPIDDVGFGGTAKRQTD